MRLFQNIFSFPSYRTRLASLALRQVNFKKWIEALVADGYNGVHLLDPVVCRNPDAFLTAGCDPQLQKIWASEHGMNTACALPDILLAQVEEHRTEVFYTQEPATYGPDFLKRLPGCVKRKICWQSPPAPLGDLTSYDLVLNNFPESLAEYGRQGVLTAYFTPSFDPVMADYASNENRPIDVVFIGGYSRHHQNRAVILEAVARLRKRFNIVFALDRGRLTRLAESPIGRYLPLGRHRRPADVQVVSTRPVFGRAMYQLLSNAKIVLNGAVDSAGGDRGNMRCFEALGCGSLLLSDPGRYPAGMEQGVTMETYANEVEAVSLIAELLSDSTRLATIAANGVRLMQDRYSKGQQWARFQELAS
ncbi:MAG: glycosyltransferase [Sulfuritalea sp.]|jgi:hypothetical protein|nr:glycosyltransferase [Sulfuritalea sp.]